ncbi:DUF3100 domain-containing protein [Kineococcus sp. SYSU DK003]|uniref:DUF3100 domain-containing protein n=1 Tax=Kineococcus sp. SYSU DK003 TaxID=3383124 RepID=UPI003D7C485F
MSTAARATPPAERTTSLGLAKVWPVFALAVVIALVCEVIGSVPIDVGIGEIVLFPMVWGILFATVVSVQKVRPLPVALQKAATAVVGTTVLVLVARLAYNVGPSLELLVDAGPALLLQEIGHLLGTVGLALPLAVLLKMGRATVGATFSLDREPSFAIVSEKYGADSDEYRGVLTMYVFGTLFGAVYITFLASLMSSAGVFDPLALAMGAGVGSGSMMAAATGAISSVYPGDEQGILAIAAVSNLLTTLLGVYVGIYVALPLAQRMYSAMTRRNTPVVDAATAERNRRFREEFSANAGTVDVPLHVTLPVIAVLGIATASIAAGGFSWEIVGGYAAMTALVLLGLALHRLVKPISSIIWITTLGAALSSPWSPVGERLFALASSVSILSLATIMLTLAGLSLGKDMGLLKSVGWKIVPVGLVAITASFALSTLIAEFALGFWG